jgi:hypothetical protein
MILECTDMVDLHAQKLNILILIDWCAPYHDRVSVLEHVLGHEYFLLSCATSHLLTVPKLPAQILVLRKLLFDLFLMA